MSDWNIYKWNTSTLLWDADGTIPRPQENLDDEISSTQQKYTLADGSNAFMTPETKYIKEPLNFKWFLQDLVFKEKIETYFSNNDYLKIETHQATITYIGRFIHFKPTWLIGQTDTWEVEAQFERME